MLAETNEEYMALMYASVGHYFSAGGVAKVGKSIVKILRVDGRNAKIIKIEGERIVEATVSTRDLVSLEVALGARSTWIEMTDDAIAIEREEEAAQTAERERKRKSKKAKPSKRIKKRE